FINMPAINTKRAVCSFTIRSRRPAIISWESLPVRASIGRQANRKSFLALNNGTTGSREPSKLICKSQSNFHKHGQRATLSKPPPRLTRTARLKLFISLFKDRLTSFWNENGRRWLTEILIVVGLLVTARIAKRNHRRLRARIARKRIEQARQVFSYPWFEMFW